METPTAADALDPLVDATALISRAVADIGDPIWQLELAAYGAMHGVGGKTGRFQRAITQILASFVALAALVWLVLRHGGSDPRAARRMLAGQEWVFALHGEDRTRTRHLRDLVARDAPPAPLVLLLGRPRGRLDAAAGALDPAGQMANARYLRPLSRGSLLRALGPLTRQMMRGVKQCGDYRGAIGFGTRIAIAYRMAQGAVHAAWWRAASPEGKPGVVVFGHTGTGDTSQLEQAMQASGWRSVHLVHGTNIGWAFAGLSDCAIFPSAADAALGKTLPAYGHCAHLPLARPALSSGNGDWALLTSYSHLLNPAYTAHGTLADRQAIGLIHSAALALGQDPARVLWRPHPQIALIDPGERELLERAAAEAGFTRWPDHLPYDALGRFSAVVTTPSTVLTDALRLGQPAIVLSLAALQRDLLYARHTLLAGNGTELLACLEQVLDADARERLFHGAWEAIGPGASPSLDAIREALAAAVRGDGS